MSFDYSWIDSSRIVIISLRSVWSLSGWSICGGSSRPRSTTWSHWFKNEPFVSFSLDFSKNSWYLMAFAYSWNDFSPIVIISLVQSEFVLFISVWTIFPFTSLHRVSPIQELKLRFHVSRSFFFSFDLSENVGVWWHLILLESFSLGSWTYPYDRLVLYGLRRGPVRFPSEDHRLKISCTTPSVSFVLSFSLNLSMNRSFWWHLIILGSISDRDHISSID